MHFLSLALKRAHWSAIKVSRPRAAKYGLTPARFDLLYVVRGGFTAYGQVDLARLLGVSEATVSRMVSSLVQMGFVRRKTYGDGRRRIVSLTDHGEAVMERAITKLVDGRKMHRVYQKLWDFGAAALGAVVKAPDTRSARAAYRAARAKEREYVFRQIQEAHDTATFLANGLRGRRFEPIYRTFHPEE